MSDGKIFRVVNNTISPPWHTGCRFATVDQDSSQSSLQVLYAYESKIPTTKKKVGCNTVLG